MRKRGFELSFAWLFAVLVGAVILFLAIYGVIKIIGVEEYRLDTITAKQLSIIFEPLETGLSSGKSNIAEFKEETKIYNECNDVGSFGENRISLETKLRFREEWNKIKGGDILVPNKYIFSSDVEQGKKIYFFSKPFEMPWKISEIIFLTTEKYCFLDTPDFVEDEILGLRLENIKLENCSGGDIKVCFGEGGSDCDIKVSGTCISDCDYDTEEYDYGFVRKQEESVFYTGSLIYAGIFSSKEIYECNVKRLMKRLTQQALIFRDEANFLVDKCSASSSGYIQLAGVAKTIENSEDLLLIEKLSKEVEQQNDAAQCELW